MAYKLLRIETNNLIVNRENPRFSSVMNEYEAIKLIVLNQKEKLINLIVDILENGLNPSELIIVSKDKDEKYKVLEGNRRVTAIKLINNLEVYEDIDKDFFEKLKRKLEKINRNKIKTITVIAFDESIEANRWLKIKHTGENKGIGVVAWSKEQKSHFIKETVKMDKIFSILEYIKESEYYSDQIKSELKNIKISQFSKLLEDPHVRETIGLKLKNKKFYRTVDEEELAKGLNKILSDLLEKSFKGTTIATKESRLEYIEKIKMEILKKESSREKKSISELGEKKISLENKQLSLTGIFNEENKVEIIDIGHKEIAYNKNLKKDIKRKYLIPSDFYLKITDKSLIQIYKELKILDINRYGNAVEILFRVFLERISNNCIRNLGIENIHENLEGKLEVILKHIKEKEIINVDQLKGVYILIKKKRGIFKAGSLNDYSIEKEYFIDKMELKNSWDTLQPLIELMVNL